MCKKTKKFKKDIKKNRRFPNPNILNNLCFRLLKHGSTHFFSRDVLLTVSDSDSSLTRVNYPLSVVFVSGSVSSYSGKLSSQCCLRFWECFFYYSGKLSSMCFLYFWECFFYYSGKLSSLCCLRFWECFFSYSGKLSSSCCLRYTTFFQIYQCEFHSLVPATLLYLCCLRLPE